MDLVNMVSINGGFALNITVVEPGDIYSRSSNQNPWELCADLCTDIFLDIHTDAYDRARAHAHARAHACAHAHAHARARAYTWPGGSGVSTALPRAPSTSVQARSH